jgi:hypothetical protein
MQYIADHKTIQRRMEQHRRRISLLYLLLAGFTFLACVGLSIGRFFPQCVVPALILVALGAVAQSIAIYVAAPHRNISTALVEQELKWLFGEDWQNSTGSVEYAFAEDRVRQRQVWRAIFPVHVLIYAAFYGTLGMVVNGLPEIVRGALTTLFGAAAAVWLAFLVLHVLWAFEPKKLLARRERSASQATERQLKASQASVATIDETFKPGAHYVVSDDGELVEVPDTEVQIQPEKRGNVFERFPLSTKWRGGQGVR